jgi:hypothetical protein
LFKNVSVTHLSDGLKSMSSTRVIKDAPLTAWMNGLILSVKTVPM